MSRLTPAQTRRIMLSAVLLLPLHVRASGSTHNDFSPEALKFDMRALKSIADRPLNDQSLKNLAKANPAVAQMLKLPQARQLMGYVVSCALGDPSQDAANTVRYSQTLAGNQIATDVWQGELGLCPGWTGAPATAECRELVSGCVLARINALGRRVPIALQAGATPLAGSVPVEQQYRDRGGFPIASFLACTQKQPWNANCDWSAGSIGTCAPGEWVKVATGGAVRVCKGLYGCDGNAAIVPDGQDAAPPCSRDDYVQGIVGEAADASGDGFTFRCPSNGYFGLMVKPANKKDPAGIAVTGAVKKYPAPASDVFTFPEGAYWGNLFDQDINVCAVVAPLNAHSCYSPLWSAGGVAYLNNRICAGSQCFNDPPDECVCAFSTMGTACSAPAGGHPVMVFLNDPRDLAPAAPDGSAGCDATLCASPCRDGIQDGDETGVDCGGSACGGKVCQLLGVDACPPLPAASSDPSLAEWAQWPAPNAPSSGLPNPASYTLLGTPQIQGGLFLGPGCDVVKDNVTGLQWQRYAPPDALNLQAARDYCANLVLGGKDDWRLPTIVELLSIVDETRPAPLIDGAYFPDPPPDGIFWSSTADATTPSASVWMADLVPLGGSTVSGVGGTAFPHHIRCVR